MKRLLICLPLALPIACGDDTSEPPPAEPQVDHFYPAPTGPHPVGVQRFELVDPVDDPLAPNGGPRTLRVSVVYPSATDKGRHAMVFDEGGYTTDFLASTRPPGMPEHPEQFELTDFGSWSLEDAPMLARDAGLPVILYSHGFRLFAEDNWAMIEHLASHGFVVAAITHSRVAGVTPLKDGGAVAHYMPAGTEDIATPEGQTYFNETVAPRIAKDVVVVHDWLRDHGAGELGGTLDLTRVGAFGYSLGGSAAIAGCAQIENCKASGNMDGILLGPANVAVAERPVLLMQGAQPVLSMPFENAGPGAHLVSVPGAIHLDFMDMNRWIVGFRTQVDTDEIHGIKQHYFLGFFERYLMDEAEAMSEWPGTDWQSK